MSTYRREWECCGSVTETDAWEPEFCPFCVDAVCAAPSAANGAEMPELPEPLEIDWPTLNRNALGCGVEDRAIHCRYDAAEYGWEDGIDKAIECVPEAIYDADQMQAYARAAVLAERASGPNAALVEALKAMLSEFNFETVHGCVHDEKAAINKAIAALAAVGVEP